MTHHLIILAIGFLCGLCLMWIAMDIYAGRAIQKARQEGFAEGVRRASTDYEVRGLYDVGLDRPPCATEQWDTWTAVL